MYLNPRKHPLSNALFISAGIRLIGSIVYAILRLWLRRGGALPDLMDVRIEQTQTIVSALQFVIDTAVLVIGYRAVAHMISVVSEDDRESMGMLQREMFGDRLPALSADILRKLLQIWMAILIGAQLFYNLSSDVYQQFVVQLSGLADTASLVTIYNSTHGFKYLAMFIAILLGIMMTGITLDDMLLKLASGIACALFTVAFRFIPMATVVILNTGYGIAWTSVLYHLLETVGLGGLALYLRRRFIGI